MTIQTEVLIETIKALNSELRWCSWNIFSTQYHAVAAITHDEFASVFSYKDDCLEEY